MRGHFTDPPEKRSWRPHDGIVWRQALLVGLTIGLGFAAIGTLSAYAGTGAELAWTAYAFNFLREAALFVPVG